MVTKKKTSTISFVHCDDIPPVTEEAIQAYELKTTEDKELQEMKLKAEKEEEIKNAIAQLKKIKDPKIKEEIKQAEEKLSKPKVMKEKEVPIITRSIEKQLRNQTIDEHPFDDPIIKQKKSKPKIKPVVKEKKIPITNNTKDVSRKKVIIKSIEEFEPVAHIKSVSYDLNWILIRRKIIAFNKGLRDYWKEMDKVVLNAASKFKRVRDNGSN